MPDELEERLKSHARSFDSLLSLIPAKLYYGEDNSDQWKRKKQTPEQKRAAKMAKLDPDNWKSAKDVADERQAAARKRKREEDGESSDLDLVEPEKPLLEQLPEVPRKKQKKSVETPSASKDKSDQITETEEDRKKRKVEQRAAKRERRREQKEKDKAKAERRKNKQKEEKQNPSSEKVQKRPKKEKSRNDKKPTTEQKEVVTQAQDEDDDDEVDSVAEEIQISAHNSNLPSTQLAEDDDNDESDDASEQDGKEIFSPLHESSTSSVSSVPIPIPTKSAKKDKTASEDGEPSAKERLAATLAAFRSARNADSEKIPKSRAELLEQRRRQEEKRKADKKEQRRREKEEEARKQEEEIEKRFSPGGSGSLLGSPRSPSIQTPDTEPNNFSFGRIAFEEGMNFDPVTGESIQTRKKGPSDPSTALKAAQSKHARVSGLDEEKKATIASQDMWMNARKRASGEKVKDNTSLLKKALKRHDGQKKKSEKEWKEREDGVKKSIHLKQKKRDENLNKRKEEKGSKGKSQKGKAKRPGFEGSFRSRTGGKKKT